jgi:Ulp1 protease family, C-terminal catalytic domain
LLQKCPDSAKNWKPINIFEKRLLIVPIHDFNHWYLCVVVNPGRNAKVIMLDSLNWARQADVVAKRLEDVATRLRDWMKSEWSQTENGETDLTYDESKATNLSPEGTRTWECSIKTSSLRILTLLAYTFCLPFLCLSSSSAT